MTYTKNQVKELLRQQREVCAEKVKSTMICFAGVNFEEIDKDSIINAPEPKL